MVAFPPNNSLMKRILSFRASALVRSAIGASASLSDISPDGPLFSKRASVSDEVLPFHTGACLGASTMGGGWYLGVSTTGGGGAYLDVSAIC